MLKWIGPPETFIPGIPPRDLSDEEIEEYGGQEKLLATGFYERLAPEKKSRRPAAEESTGGE